MPAGKMKQVSKKRSYRRVRINKPIKKYVKKEINKSKQVNEKLHLAFGSGSGSGYQNYDFPARPLAQADIMRLIPTIARGTQIDQREGNKVRITSLTGSFFAHIPAAYTASPEGSSAAAGITCRLLILSCKQVQAVGQFEANWDAGQLFNRQFLKNGATPEGYQGDLWSLRWPVNTELFTKHYDKMFTLKRGLEKVQGSNGLTVMPEVCFNHRFRIKCRNKVLQFNDPSTTEHTNWSLFGVLLYAANDSTLLTGSPGPVKGNLYTKINWKEA